jgi:hypothetical protein
MVGPLICPGAEDFAASTTTGVLTQYWGIRTACYRGCSADLSLRDVAELCHRCSGSYGLTASSGWVAAEFLCVVCCRIHSRSILIELLRADTATHVFGLRITHHIGQFSFVCAAIFSGAWTRSRRRETLEELRT